MSPNLDYPVLVLDWDYRTFGVLDDKGRNLALYEAPDDSHIVIVEGWLWPGKSIPQTLYQRVKGVKFECVGPLDGADGKLDQQEMAI